MSASSPSITQTAFPLSLPRELCVGLYAQCNRHGQSRCFPHHPRHLHRLRPSGRDPHAHWRLRQEGSVADGGAEHRLSNAFDQYLKAVNDERLARTQDERAKILYDKGAIAKSQLEIADDGEQDAKTDLTAAEQQLIVLGVDKATPH